MAWRASITIILLIIFVLAVQGRQLPEPPVRGVVLGTTTAAVLTSEPPADPSFFSETGTLVFYPNNVGPVPYLYYTDLRGSLRAIALVLPEPLNQVGTWSGGRVAVTGRRVYEHVEVATLTYLAPP